jgi:hypothetical protein
LGQGSTEGTAGRHCRGRAGTGINREAGGGGFTVTQAPSPPLHSRIISATTGSRRLSEWEWRLASFISFFACQRRQKEQRRLLLAGRRVSASSSSPSPPALPYKHKVSPGHCSQERAQHAADSPRYSLASSSC